MLLAVGTSFYSAFTSIQNVYVSFLALTQRMKCKLRLAKLNHRTEGGIRVPFSKPLVGLEEEGAF